jgi:hypothetical protein
VLNGLAAGERVIVPIADPIVPAWPWRRLLWAAVAVLALVAGARLVLVNELHSEASLLEITPAEPSAGQQITVTYHASGQLAKASTLRLRALYRRAGDREGWNGVPRIATALLKRESDRTYRADLRLPPDAAYATFAVEDEAGQVVDYRGSPQWELLVYAEGRPSYDALFQRAEAAAGIDLGAALESAVEATRLYPDRVEAWATRSTFEREAYGSDSFDSLRVVHGQRVQALDDQLRRTPVSADVIGAMYRYANAWNVENVAERWRQRALRDAPRSALAVQLRTFDILLGHENSPREVLRLLDDLYQEAGAVPPMLPSQAFGVAYELKDPAACVRWAERLIAIEPWQRGIMARRLLSFPSLRDTALAWIDGEIQRLSSPDDRYRPLFSSVPRYRGSVDSARSDLLGLKGQLLLGMGDIQEARAYLDSAVAQGWDVARFRAAATAHLAAGDTPGAAQLLARIAVDPAADDRRHADQEGSRLRGATAWAAERARALRDMMTETRREAEPRRLYDPVRVTGRLGDTVDLREALQGHVTVVAFWHPLCRTCVADLEGLSHLVARQPGAPRLAIVSRRPLEPADWDRLDAAGLAPLVTVDGKDEAMRAFGVWGTAGVFVVDARGVIQYRDRSLGDLARSIMALVPLPEVVAAQGRADTKAATADRP